MRLDVQVPSNTLQGPENKVKSVAVLKKIPAFFSNIFGTKTIQCNIQKPENSEVIVCEISMGSLLKATGKESSFSKSQVRQLASIVKHNLCTDEQPANIDDLVSFLSLDSNYLEIFLNTKNLDLEPETFQKLVNLVKNENIKPKIFKRLIDVVTTEEVQPGSFSIIVSLLELHRGFEIEELDELNWFFDLAKATKSTEDFEYILDLFLFDETISSVKYELLYDALVFQKVPYDKFLTILMGYNGKFDQITDENLKRILQLAQQQPKLDLYLFENILDSHYEQKTHQLLFGLLNNAIFDEGLDFEKWFIIKEFIEILIEDDTANEMTKDKIQALIDLAKDDRISSNGQIFLCFQALHGNLTPTIIQLFIKK